MGLFDDLVPEANAATSAPAGGLFSDLIPETAAAPARPERAKPRVIGFEEPRAPDYAQLNAPVYGDAPEQQPTASPVADIFAPVYDTKAAMPEATTGRRMIVNAKEGFDNTLAGELVNRVQSGQINNEGAASLQRAIADAESTGSPVGLDNFSGKPVDASPTGSANPHAGKSVEQMRSELAQERDTAVAKAGTYGATRATNEAESAAFPSWQDTPSLLGKLFQGGAALLGQVAGGLPSPENLLPISHGVGAARAVGEGVLPYAARIAAPGAVEGAVGNSLANPAVQFGQQSRGEHGDFSPEELAQGVVIGGGIGGGLKLTGALFGALRNSIARMRNVDPVRITPADVTPDDFATAVHADPEFAAAVASDPQFAAFAKANNIEGSADPRMVALQDRLQARRVEDAAKPPAESLPVGPGADAELVRRQAEKDGVADGTIDPAATNLAPRVPNEAPIRVDSQGGAFREDAGALAGRDKGAILERADQKALPAPGKAHMTPEEIAALHDEKFTPTPETLYGQEGRAPQTRDDLPGQRAVSDAFTLADAQRGRAGPDVRDTQVAGRPEGANAQPVHMDEGHPVDITGRRMVPDASGKMVEVATVRRYDPRTGAHEPGSVEYDVPVKQLTTKDYAVDPRRAQDFEARAETANVNGGRDRGKRMDEAQGLPHQTYRQTAADPHPTESGRYSRPEQPAGPHPGQRWSTAEEAARDFADRQARGEAGARGTESDSAKAKATSQAREPGKDGRFHTDEHGHVLSTAQGPVRFANQLQAGKWILNVGQKKSPDQIFEVANHPSGRGFTARETGRSEPPPTGRPGWAGDPPPEKPAAPQSAREKLLAQANAGPTPHPPASGHPPQSGTVASIRTGQNIHYGRPGETHADLQTRIEKDNKLNPFDHATWEIGRAGPDGRFVGVRDDSVYPADTKGLTNDAPKATTENVAPPPAGLAAEKLGDGPAHASSEAARAERANLSDRAGAARPSFGALKDQAQFNVFHQETAEHLTPMLESHGLTPDDAQDLFRHYDRAAGETPQAALDRAIDKWGDTEERAAMQDHSLDSEYVRDMAELRRHFESGEGQMNPGFVGEPKVFRGGERAIDRSQQPHLGLGGHRNQTLLNDAKVEDIPFHESDHPTGQDGPPARDSGSAGPRREADTVQGTGADAARQDPAAGGGERRSEFATDAGPDGKRQTVIPGAEQRPVAGNPADRPLKGGNEPPPKGGLFDEDARNQTDIFDPSRMNSNPLADPAVWKFMGKSLGFNAKWLKETSALINDFGRIFEGRGEKTSNLGDLARMITYSSDGALRALGEHYGNSPTIKAIADLLHAPADVGRGGAVGRTFAEGVNARVNKNLNDMARSLEQFSDKPAVLKQIAQLVQNPNRIRKGTPIHDAADMIRGLLESEHAYLKKSGVDIGYVKGYFPRELDVSQAMRNPAGFKAAAERAYRASGLVGQAAKDAADNWLERVTLGGVNVRPDGTDFVTLGGSPKSNFANARTLTKAADEIMSNFYHTDPLEALTVHFQRTARRAEWASRFGDDLSKWKEMKAAMIKEGNAAAIPEVVRFIATSTGASPGSLPKSVSGAIGWLRTYGVVRLLPRATITSLSESLLPSIRAGSPGRMVSDIVTTTRALWERSGKLGEQREFAEDLGLIMKGSENGVLASRFNAVDPANRVQERILNRFFRATGLEQYTTATRVTAVNSAEAFIRRLALDVDKGNSRKASAHSLLTELGVSDTKGFAKWVAGQEGSVARDFKSNTAHEEAYRSAVVRFANQAIMSPTASTKPRWASHPLGSMIFMLQSYAYAFHKNVLHRAGSAIAEAATNKSYTMGDRARVLAPVAMLPALLAVQMGIAPLREAVFGTSGKPAKTKDEDVTRHALQAISRSGLTGMLDPLYNIYTGAKYQRDFVTAASGPVAGLIGHTLDVMMALAPQHPTGNGMIDAAIGGPNSSKTNTAERNATRALYDLVVAPAAMTAASMLPAGIGSIAAQLPGVSSVKDAFVDGIAGAEHAKGGSRTSSHERATRSTR